MSKLIPSTTEFYVGETPKHCALITCQRPIVKAFVDCKIPGIGSWADVCINCFKSSGAKLGVGQGQAFQLTPKGWAKLVPAAEAKPTKRKPSLATLERWSNDGVAKSTDGCKVEPDGVCPHGCKSWLLELGLI